MLGIYRLRPGPQHQQDQLNQFCCPGCQILSVSHPCPTHFDNWKLGQRWSVLPCSLAKQQFHHHPPALLVCAWPNCPMQRKTSHSHFAPQRCQPCHGCASQPFDHQEGALHHGQSAASSAKCPFQWNKLCKRFLGKQALNWVQSLGSFPSQPWGRATSTTPSCDELQKTAPAWMPANLHNANVKGCRESHKGRLGIHKPKKQPAGHQNQPH